MKEKEAKKPREVGAGGKKPAAPTRGRGEKPAVVAYDSSSAMHTLNVTKANNIIEANYHLTLQEQRVILTCIGHIDPRLPLDEQRVFRIQASEFIARFGVPQNHAYRELKAVAERLWEREVLITDPRTGVIDKYRWVSRATYLKKQGAVTLYLAPEILPYLTALKERFTTFPLSAIAGLKSTFAIRLYELLAQYRNFGKRAAPVADWRRWLDCSESFERYTDFERWVIEVAVKQINESSDIRVKYTKIKQGRSVSHLEFTFTPAAVVKRDGVAKAAPESKEEADRRWRARMAELGVVLEIDGGDGTNVPRKP